MAILLSVLWLLLNTINAAKESESDIFVGPLKTFAETHPNTISMHFSCPESNMFATNCACHLKCTVGKSCQNAVQLCKKYRLSHGCKYVLTRNNNKIATLKREITIEEKKRFDISEFKYMNHSSSRPMTPGTVSRPPAAAMTFRDMISSSAEVANTYKSIIQQAKVRNQSVQASRIHQIHDMFMSLH